MKLSLLESKKNKVLRIVESLGPVAAGLLAIALLFPEVSLSGGDELEWKSTQPQVVSCPLFALILCKGGRLICAFGDRGREGALALQMFVR